MMACGIGNRVGSFLGVVKEDDLMMVSLLLIQLA